MADDSEVKAAAAATVAVAEKKSASRAQRVQTTEARQDGAIETLTRLGQSGPPWAAGLAIVLAALVSFVLALGLNVSSIMNSYIESQTEGQRQEMTLASNQASMSHDSATQIISALDSALNEQSLRIADLSTENQALKTTVLTLQFQVQAMTTKYGATDYAPVVAPTAVMAVLIPTPRPESTPALLTIPGGQ